MTTHYRDMASRFKALAHPVRLQILDMLRNGEVCVCHMEAALGKRQAYISQQLMVLRNAGLVESRKDGLQVFYRLTDGLTESILNVALGPIQQDAFDVLDSCPCPRCTAATSNIEMP